MRRRLVVAAGFVLLALAPATLLVLAQSSESVVKARGYLSVDSIRPGDKFKIAVELQVADGYHINAHVPTLSYLVPTTATILGPDGIKFGDATYPPSEKRAFDFAPDTKLEVHEGTVIITADAEAAKTLALGENTIKAEVQVQSCNNSQCLAPAKLDVEIPVNVVGTPSAVKPANGEVFSKAAAALTAPPLQEIGGAGKPASGGGEQPNQVSAWIEKYGLSVTLIFVFLSGLALNTTPCVYPIIPITIGFFANQSKEGEQTRLGRMFGMAVMYVLGMSITYSVLGVIASLTHGLFGAALRNPLVLIALALVMVALALSMFGVYEFRLPAFLNTFATSSTQSTSGMLGALVMGLTMGIVAAPCIGPFVLALLVHVGAKGSPAYGFMLFFVLSLGLGAPYLVLGTFSGAIAKLPRSGLWMVTVRKVFGLVLIGMAIYFLMPLLGAYSTPVVVSFFALSALYLIFWESGRTKPKQFAWILRIIGVAAGVAAVLFVLPGKTEAEITWQPYSESLVATARTQRKAVIIDTYADWCIPCKELDKRTFTDPAIRKEAESFVMLKLNLTKNDPGTEEGRAAKQFDIRGVPTVLFIDPSGHVHKDLTLQGFEKPDGFRARMEKLGASPSASSPNSTIASAGTSTGAPTPGQLEAVPAATVNLLSGGSLDLAAKTGKVTVIDFWATWCIPCASEIPVFNALAKQYKNQGLEIVAIALDEEGAPKVRPFLKDHKMDYTIAIGDEGTKKAFGVGEVLPVTIIVDRQGRIQYTHTGIIEDKAAFQSQIERLLKQT